LKSIKDTSEVLKSCVLLLAKKMSHINLNFDASFFLWCTKRKALLANRGWHLNVLAITPRYAIVLSHNDVKLCGNVIASISYRSGI
jgi:hypothetical protein